MKWLMTFLGFGAGCCITNALWVGDKGDRFGFVFLAFVLVTGAIALNEVMKD